MKSSIRTDCSEGRGCHKTSPIGEGLVLFQLAWVNVSFIDSSSKPVIIFEKEKIRRMGVRKIERMNGMCPDIG
jgi:hypothetical protein